MPINPTRHSGLTLVEVLIVVILMGLIAVVAIPRFSMTTNVTLENKLDTHLRSLRRAIEGSSPGLRSAFEPDSQGLRAAS